MSTSKKEQIQAEVTKIAEIMRPLISFDESGNPELIDKEVFVKNLPEGITAEQVTQLGDYTRNFNAGTTTALDVAIPKFVENNQLDRMKLTVPMVGAHNSIDFTMQRERVSHNPANGEEITNYGHVTVAVNQGHTGSVFKTAHHALRDLARAALAENK